MDKATRNAFEPAEHLDDAPAALMPGSSAADEPANNGDRSDFPCSVAQERFWLLDRLEPGNSSYNVAVRWRLEGRVSTALLEKAWLRIIERHEILRTVFLEVDGAPVQRVLPRCPFKLAEIDLGNLPEDARQAEGDRIGAIEARAPFDVISGPLLRATLLRYTATESVLYVTTHQIVSDGWSIGIMAREMGEIYRALRDEQPVPLEALSLQYADYSMWQLEWLAARGTEAEERYWTGQLAGLKPFKVLPDHPRPAVPTTNGAIASMVLPREVTTKAQALCGEHGATLFAAALSALTAALSRYTGETEIVVGTQVSDRDQVELEGMIGQFVNSLILRNDLAGDPSFSELIERSRDTSAQALEHRHIPIERLLSMVKTDRSGANSALISVNFIFQRTFIQNLDYGDFQLVDLPSLPAGAIYDLNFFMVERPDGWRFSCQYNTDQFEAETVNRLLDYVHKALASGIENPRRKLSELALVDAEERQQLLVSYNQTAAACPPAATLASLFEAQVARTPDATAVQAGEVRLSYRQLDVRANRLAHHLLAQGIQPGQRVGVCVDRSEDLPISLLAVAKAGGAFLALDPSEPPARLAQLIEAAGLSLLILGAAWRGNPGSGKVRRLDLAAAKPEIERRPSSAPVLDGPPGDEACLVFVASSGARPLGIRIGRQALASRLLGLLERPGLGPQDVLVAVTPVGLDLALLELLLPLIAGARLVIASVREVNERDRLLQLLRRVEATVLHATAELWSALIAGDWQGPTQLRALYSSEARDRRLIAQLLDRCAELWSLHACSEATICVSAHRVLPHDELMPIAGPLANTRLYVLDPSLQPPPMGAPGLLHVGGDCIALGYIEASTEDQQRFVSDPFSGVVGARLFNTGDRGRVRQHGQIEYLGRVDSRFSLHGYRIEPAEIEAVLLRHPNVLEAAVIPHREPGSPPTIEAFVGSPNTAQAPELVTALRGMLDSALPAQQQPARIVVLAVLPKTADGSLDRRALARRMPSDSAGAAPMSLRPTNAIEAQLLKLWGTMLGRDDIDVTANFFELGGHSLLAARMLGRVEAEFGRRISLAGLFRAPTIRELAQLLDRNDLRDFDFRQVLKLQPLGSRPPVIGINNTGIYYMLAKRLGADQPFTSLQLFDPSVKTAELPKTLEEIAAGYVQLIRRVQPTGPYVLMGWCVAGALAFEVACQLDAKFGELAQLYLMDSWVPNYRQRLPALRSLIADYSLRWQFILADWRAVRASGGGVAGFFRNRLLVKKFLRMLGLQSPAGASTAETREVTPEDYDQWLLGYLQTLTSRYEPKVFRGRILLFRSHAEPTGWWFDPHAGWGPFAAGGVDLQMVMGDHFTMFSDPGVSQMAERIAELCKQPGT